MASWLCLFDVVMDEFMREAIKYNMAYIVTIIMWTRESKKGLAGKRKARSPLEGLVI